MAPTLVGLDAGFFRAHGRPGRKDATMDDSMKRAPRLVALCMLGCLLFNYPILALFNIPAAIAGIPVLYAWIFAAWIVLVALMALAAEGED